MRTNRVANLPAQGKRRWPRTPLRTGRSFLLTARTLSQLRFNQKIYPASLPRAIGARNATSLTQPNPKFSPKVPTITFSHPSPPPFLPSHQPKIRAERNSALLRKPNPEFSPNAYQSGGLHSRTRSFLLRGRPSKIDRGWLARSAIEKYIPS